MSILDINKKKNEFSLKKTVVVYLILSFAAIAIDNIYALFGHGVSSAAMSWMFLYPFVGGTLVYTLVALLAPAVSRAEGFRLSANIYNSGIATLTIGSFLKGILDIAGTASSYTIVFYAAGVIFTIAGLVIFLIRPLRGRLNREPI